MPILELKGVKVERGGEIILQDISFILEKGETVAVIGPNGSGKTTLLRALIGAVPFEGEIHLAKELTIGYVPQKIDIERGLPLNCREFLSLGKSTKPNSSFKPEEVLEMVHLPSSYLARGISTLSSGEFQRVLIAFALLHRPGLLLFDEPTANVDVAGQETIYDLLHRLQDTYHFAIVLVSHDLTVVYRYADKVLCLNREQLCFGIPAEVLTPQELARLYGQGRKFYQHPHV